MSSSLHRWIVLLALPMLLGVSSRGGDRGEYEVKAAFLVNFTHFVEWPDSSLTGPFTICVIGSDPFGDVLDRIVGVHSVNGKPIFIKRFTKSIAGESCQVAFIGDLNRGNLMRLLPVLQASHSLTVGDSLEFAEHYGIIGFFLENQRVSLALHPDRALKSGLKINSQLTRVARIIPGDGGRP